MRPLTALSLATWSAILLACAAPPSKTTDRPAPQAARSVETSTVSTEPVAPVAPEAPRPPKTPKLPQAEIDRRRESWRGHLEERADALSVKGDALEAKLAERKATQKRRTEMGLIDSYIRDEIEKLQKEADTVWAELSKIEDRLAAGPPASLFEADAIPEEATAASEPSKPTKPSPPTVVATQPSSPPATFGGGLTFGGGFTAMPSGRSGTVHVSGYTRKDGTYVHPHTRSAPRRR